MEQSKYLNFQTLNNQDDQNKAIHQTDTCQENDNKQDIELEEIFLPVVDDSNKEQEKKKEILSKHPSPDMCSRGINTTIKSCNGKKQESNSEFVVGLGGGVEGQKCFLSISKTKKGIFYVYFSCDNAKFNKSLLYGICENVLLLFYKSDIGGKSDDCDSDERSSCNGEGEEVILLMKNPDIIRHSISATNFTLSSLGFQNQAFHTYSSSDRDNNASVEKQNVPDSDKMIQGGYK